MFKWIRTKFFLHTSIAIVSTVKWVQLLLSNTFIEYLLFVCRQWSGYKYCYLTQIILFYITHLYTVKWYQVGESCWGSPEGCLFNSYYFPWIAPLPLIPYIAECQARWYQVPFLKSLVWRDLGLNPSLPDHWQTLYPLGQWAS